MNTPNKPVLLFAPETFNIAETTRMIQCAKACQDQYSCIFMGYGGQFSHLITDAGFELKELEPRLTPEMVELLWKVDRFESFKNPFTYQYLNQRVESELGLLKEFKPKGLVMGFTLSCALSARIAQVPLIYIIPFAMSEPYMEHFKGPAPDLLRRGLLKLIPESWIIRIYTRFLVTTGIWMKPFQQVAKAHGIKPMTRLVELFSGDYNLVTDLPELTGVEELPPNWEYIGFIYAKLDNEIPQEVLDLPRDKPIVYCAMGSSGRKDILKKVIEAFDGLDVRVICPMKDQLAELAGTFKVPENVLLTGWLPAHLVNPLANIAVIHGGQGTVQTAIDSATPFVGIAMQPEQEGNIEAVVAYGCARRISKYQVTKKNIQAEINHLLEDRTAKIKAEELAQLSSARPGAENAARAIKRILDSQ